MSICMKGGLIVDGTGERPFYGDILIEKDKIVKIGKHINAGESRVVDATGKVVIPGIIDGHTHAEIDVLRNPQLTHAVYQGVTTIITGQCGLGFAPMQRKDLECSIRMNSGIFGDWRKYQRCWNTFDEMLGDLDGAAINVGANVSHNAIRQYACGFQDVSMTGEKLAVAKDQLRKALRAGATGFSVGLSYYPGGYSDTGELIELCRVVREEDGIFCVHLRLDDGQAGRSPVEEIVEVVKQTGVRLNMLHYRTSGMESTETLFEPFRELTDQGAEIYYEYYPYLAGAGLILALIPGWAQEGGYEKIMERLRKQEQRDRLIKDIEERRRYFFAPNQTARIIITKDPYSEYLGRTLSDISDKNQETYAETIIRLLVENELEVGFAGIESQEESLKIKLTKDQNELFLNERYTIGSDTIPAGILSHPRAFGTFPRILRRMRECKVPIEFTVRKLTALPAEIYGIRDRGVLKEGMYADICMIDDREIRDCADFENARQKPKGITHVFVNGLPVLSEGTLTGVFGGRAVRRR